MFLKMKGKPCLCIENVTMAPVRNYNIYIPTVKFVTNCVSFMLVRNDCLCNFAFVTYTFESIF